MIILRDPDTMRCWSFEQRRIGRSVGLVPTMGALHEGHTSLVEASVAGNDVTVVSVFVNPAQFAPHEDYGEYPRGFQRDCSLIESLGGDVVYAPTADAMYPKGYATYVEVERLQDGLCGITRPHFFRGVATVVAKLFNAVTPDHAYFGEKDGQQAAIIRRMVRDLDFGVEIVTLPTVREEDGLAMSSRNEYLSAGDRERALCLSRALFQARDALEAGERNAERILDEVRRAMCGVDIDYVSMVDAVELTAVDGIEGPVLLAVAATVGKTRLIDNIQFDPPESRVVKRPRVSARRGTWLLR